MRSRTVVLVAVLIHPLTGPARGQALALRADLRGGLEREVQVDVHLDRLQFYDVSIQDVLDAIRSENVNIPGGTIDVGSLKYLVRVDGQFDDPKASSL